MRDHPQIFISEPKELAFFSKRFDKGRLWYLSYFENSVKSRHAGEFTSHYLYDSNVPQRMLETLGQVKILAVIREPVARAVSQIKYGIRHGFLDRPADPTIYLPQLLRYIDVYSPIVDRSLYSAGIRRFVGAMGREKVLVLDQSDCYSNPDIVLEKVWRFLDVDERFVSKTSTRQVSVGITPKIMVLESIRKRVFYFVNSHAPHLVTLSRRFGLGDLYRRANAGPDIKLSQKAVDYLNHFFEDDWIAASAYCWRPKDE
jgi:hypothetical protein